MTVASEADGNLLEALRRRDTSALEGVIAGHSRALFANARALGFDSHDSEDLVQETLTTFLETLDRFEGRSALRTWMIGILYRKALERRRGLAKEARTDSIEEIVEGRFDRFGRWARPPGDIERLLASKKAGTAILACMESLAMRQRAAFLLRELEELETPEICKILAISVTNLGVLLHRGRNRMRECLEAKGITAS